MLRRIMVIDPDPTARGLLRYCLMKVAPQAVLDIYNPEDGLPGPDFDWKRYDLIVIEYELELAQNDGLGWIMDLRKLPGVPHIIMLTAHGTAELAIVAREQGAYAYLDKDTVSPKMVQTILREIQGAERTRTFKHATQQGDSRGAQAPGNANDATAPQIALPSRGKISASGNFSRSGQGPSSLRIPGYRVQSALAEGGMASVFLAARDEDGLPAVLKVLRLAGGKDVDVLKRFMREYEIIAGIDHANVVKVYDRGFAADFAYIALEYFPGGDLKEAINGGIAAAEVLPYLKQIALGLGAAHQRGIVHRDMKPANILFRNRAELAVTDFGVAKELSTAASLTQHGEVVGTLQYISPERLQGIELDHRSDLFSLGVILFQMLTGERPFQGSDLSSVMSAILHQPVRRLDSGSAKYQALLDGLLAKDPDERFQSVEEVLAGIEFVSESAAEATHQGSPDKCIAG